MHNRLDGARAERLAELVRALHEPLLLDSGDAIGAGNVTCRPWGEPILERMNALGYAAMAMGNREFHVLPAWLRMKVRQARFPVLAANLYPKGRRQVPFQASVTVGVRGLTVGILGVINPMVRKGGWVERLSGLSFADPVEAAQAEAAQLRGQCDVVIALAHCRDEATACIAGLPDVDITLGGHAHRDRVQIEPGAVWIESGSHAQHASLVTLDVASRAVSVERISLATGRKESCVA